VSLTNRDIAELLARRGDETEGPRRRAYLRASAAAFVWTEEAAQLLADGRPLTELRYVGDRLAGRIANWIESETEVPEPPPSRRGFATLSLLSGFVRANPDWEKDLRSDLQMHTTYSDGLASVEAMARACAGRGYSHIAVTDHSEGQRIPAGMDGAALARQSREIAEVNEELERDGTELRVLCSIEMNLYVDGSGAIPPDELDAFELVVGSFHSALRTEEDETERYLTAVRSSGLDILGHPRGRMYNRRGGLNADWEMVFDAALEADVAFEINANPARQDLQSELLELAGERGLRLSIGTDSHSLPELDFVTFSLGAALAAGINRARILNFMPVDELLEWRRGRRG
jgi:histidinol phosphatase-like PHP family hydrolase